MSSSRLVVMADGLLSVLDERLAPPGMSIADHYLHVARKLHDAEIALAELEIEPGPFDTDEPDGQEERRRATRCSRPRGRTSASPCGCAHASPGQHASRAGEPLRAGLRKLAEDVEPQEARQLLFSAAHALIVVLAGVGDRLESGVRPGRGHLDR